MTYRKNECGLMAQQRWSDFLTNAWNDSIFIVREEPLGKKKSFKGKLIDGEISTDWDKKYI